MTKKKTFKNIESGKHSEKQVQDQSPPKQKTRDVFKQLKAETCKPSLRDRDPTTVSFKNADKHRECRKLETELLTPF